MTLFRLPALALLLASSAAHGLPVLSEVFYDAVGSDDGKGFIELAGSPGASLDGLVLEAVNGNGGAVYATIALSGVVPGDGLFVLADRDSQGATAVPGADLLADFDLQNGPDSLVLRGPGGVLDALAYGVFGAGQVAAGEGMPAPDPSAGSSLARRFADVDTDRNATDFVILAAPSPGTAPYLRGVPEGLPLGAGMLWMASLGGWRGVMSHSWCRGLRPSARRPRLPSAGRGLGRVRTLA